MTLLIIFGIIIFFFVLSVIPDLIDEKKKYISPQTQKLLISDVFDPSPTRKCDIHTDAKSIVPVPDFDFDMEIIEDSDRIDGLLILLSESEQVWIVGGQGAGKSTLLAHLSDEYSKKGMLLIIDSHNEPGKWPDTKNVRVIGTGKNYKQIAAGLNAITQEIETRIRDLGTGVRKQNEFCPMRILVDEFTMVPMQMTELYGKKDGTALMTKFRNSLFTEGRKVKIFPCFATHSSQASSVGFSGAMDMFHMINHKVFLKNINGDRFAEVQFGEEKKTLKYAVTGVHPRLESIKEENRNLTPPVPVWPEITDITQDPGGKKKPIRNISDPTIGGMRCDPQPSPGQKTGARNADRITN